MKLIPTTGLWLLAALLPGCDAGNTPAGDTPMATITIEAFYRERMMVPPNAQLRVTLSDVSKMDVAATLLTEAVIDNPGAPPYTVSLNYDPTVIDQRMRYAVRAAISVDDQLLFTSTEHIDAFAVGDSDVIKVNMQRVAARKASDKAAASLTDTYWKLVKLEGKPATIGAGGKELYLQLLTEDARFHGFSGCNAYSGGYSLEGANNLKFGHAMSTRMACAQGMEQEHAYLSILGEVASYRVDGQSLTLFAAGNKALAGFESRDMQQ
jgi:putative lipoprotein